MAKVEITREQTVCDRCGDPVAKHREAIALTNHGVDLVVGLPITEACRLDMCRPCEKSLQGWWARGKKGDE